ncbi:MAG: hypothetical protein ACFE8G_06115 [Candidatus Hermodarchaeota archaeon]
MAVSKKNKIIHVLTDFPKYKILDEVKEKAKKELNFFTTLETDPDPVQMRRNIKKWKKSMGYYILHPEKFKFGLKNLDDKNI